RTYGHTGLLISGRPLRSIELVHTARASRAGTALEGSANMASIHDDLLDMPTSPRVVDLAPPAKTTRDERSPSELLSDFWRRIKRRKWLVLLITVLATAGAGIYSLAQPTQYDSTATLYFPQTST